MHQERIEIRVPESKAKERIDVFLARQIAYVSRSQIKKLIKEGSITVDGTAVKQNYNVRPNDCITILVPKAAEHEPVKPQNIPIDILFEDDYLLVVNKPAGMVVHPAVGHRDGTLVNAILGHNQNIAEIGDNLRPGLVHRIDKDTSGILVIAKNNYVHACLAKLFAEKDIEREYIAFVWRDVRKNSQTVSTYINRHAKDRKKMAVAKQGKFAITNFYVQKRYTLVTMMRCILDTGRTHQIRVHAAHIGHPVVGDHTYGGRGRNLGGLNRELTAFGVRILELMQRQALHAHKLGFVHPVTKKYLQFSVDFPEDMKQLHEFLERDYNGETNEHI